jgi:hypothetical protein
MSGEEVLIFARDLFLENENIANINGRLKLKGSERVNAHMLASWYYNYMVANRVEPSKIDNVITWVDFMNENYVREYMGHHFLVAEEVPYVPWADQMKCSKNNRLIEQTRSDGKYPKLKLESAIEDRRDPETGEIIIRNAWKPVRIFMPSRPWRHPSAKGPVPKLLQRQQQNAGMRLIDKDDRGSLYDWELLSKPHRKYDMSKFLINEDRRKRIAARGPSAPEYLW